jgi:hypothetical protein
MTPGTKLAAYGAALAVVFTGALGLGAVAGPIGDDDGDDAHTVHDTEPGAVVAELPGGLQASADGYTLDLLTRSLPAGAPATLRFRILDATGVAVVAFDELHERQLHLIVIDRQLDVFQHVHPTRADDGTWSIDLALDPGTYRLFTDIAPTARGRSLTLGTDLVVPGDVSVAPPADPSTVSHVDGYEVTLTGDLVDGQTSDVALTISRDGTPVTDLDPYLGAYGHLVAIRAGDLAYLHVHPTGEPGDGHTAAGPDVGFGVAVPGPGTYRLFLDFRHDGVVRTADFTVVVPPGGAATVSTDGGTTATTPDDPMPDDPAHAEEH